MELRVGSTIYVIDEDRKARVDEILDEGISTKIDFLASYLEPSGNDFFGKDKFGIFGNRGFSFSDEGKTWIKFE